MLTVPDPTTHKTDSRPYDSDHAPAIAGAVSGICWALGIVPPPIGELDRAADRALAEAGLTHATDAEFGSGEAGR